MDPFFRNAGVIHDPDFDGSFSLDGRQNPIANVAQDRPPLTGALRDQMQKRLVFGRDACRRNDPRPRLDALAFAGHKAGTQIKFAIRDDRHGTRALGPISFLSIGLNSDLVRQT
jgi:hypothetical protein